MKTKPMALLAAAWTAALLASACADDGPSGPDVPDGGIPDGELSIAWDGRTVDWGAPEVLRAEVEGQPVEVEWRSLSDLYLGQPVVLGRGEEVSTAPLRPGTSVVEARILQGTAVVKRATSDVTVRYRESWNLTLEGMVPYTGETVGDLWVSDGLAFVARRGAGGVSVLALDGGVREVGRFTAPNLFSQDIVAADDKVYVTNETNAYPFAVTILDVSDPAHPVVLGGVPSADVGMAHTVWLDGTLLALASQVTKAIHLYDVTDPAHPLPLSAIQAGNATAHDIHVRDGRLFGAYMALSAGQDAELVFASVADPAHPAVLARVHYPGAVLTHSSWLTPDGNVLYVADEIVNAPIRIFDVTNPLQPILVSTYQPRLGTIPHHFHVRDDRTAYLSHYKHGLEVVDLSDPLHPRLVAFYDTHPGMTDDQHHASGALAPSHEDQKGGGLYEGVWGVDWTADGRIVASDINRGVFVFRSTGD